MLQRAIEARPWWLRRRRAHGGSRPSCLCVSEERSPVRPNGPWPKLPGGGACVDIFGHSATHSLINIAFCESTHP